MRQEVHEVHVSLEFQSQPPRNGPKKADLSLNTAGSQSLSAVLYGMHEARLLLSDPDGKFHVRSTGACKAGCSHTDMFLQINIYIQSDEWLRECDRFMNDHFLNICRGRLGGFNSGR